MKKCWQVFLLVIVSGAATSPVWGGAEDEARVSSRIVRTEVGWRVLVQEAWLDAPVERVWKAYTTAEGWTAWASSQAEVDLRVGGTIRTRYDTTGEIGAPGTITLHIGNFVPNEILTLKADIVENFPEVLKKDADKLSNVIVFERVSDTRTHLRSYGFGYGDAPELDDLLKFFMGANEGLLRKLKVYVETGKRSASGQ